jgi:tetratricopeptide (TPR) repeat protein
MNTKIDCFFAIKDFDSAIVHSQQLISKLNNTNSTFYTQSKIWLKMAYIFKDANNLDEALKCIDKCIDLNPDNLKEKYTFLCHLYQN